MSEIVHSSPRSDCAYLIEVTSQFLATAALQILLPRKPFPPHTTIFRLADADAAVEAIVQDSVCLREPQELELGLVAYAEFAIVEQYRWLIVSVLNASHLSMFGPMFEALEQRAMINARRRHGMNLRSAKHQVASINPGTTRVTLRQLHVRTTSNAISIHVFKAFVRLFSELSWKSMLVGFCRRFQPCASVHIEAESLFNARELRSQVRSQYLGISHVGNV